MKKHRFEVSVLVPPNGAGPKTIKAHTAHDAADAFLAKEKGLKGGSVLGVVSEAGRERTFTVARKGVQV